MKIKKACIPAKLLQLCPTLCNTVDYKPCPWDSLGKNTGVGCHAPPPGDLHDPGVEAECPVSPALQVDSLPLLPPGKPNPLYNSI